MVISEVKSKANFSSVTDSEPFLSARLIFLMDCERETITIYNNDQQNPDFGALSTKITWSRHCSLNLIQHGEQRANFYSKVFRVLLKGAHVVQTIFLKVAHVLLLVVLCSKMAVLLIRSPTFSLKNKNHRERKLAPISSYLWPQWSRTNIKSILLYLCSPAFQAVIHCYKFNAQKC